MWPEAHARGMHRKVQRQRRVSRRVAVAVWIGVSVALWFIIGTVLVTIFQAGDTLISRIFGADERGEDVLIKPAGK